MFRKKVKIERGFLYQAYEHDAGYDLSFEPANKKDWTIEIPSLSKLKVPTGVVLKIPKGYEAQIRSRSGLAINSGIFVLNSPATIDSGYGGEIQVILFNTSKFPFVIRKGDRIAQMVFQKLPKIKIIQTSYEKKFAKRGEKGFGSSGK